MIILTTTCPDSDTDRCAYLGLLSDLLNRPGYGSEVCFAGHGVAGGDQREQALFMASHPFDPEGPASVLELDIASHLAALSAAYDQFYTLAFYPNTTRGSKSRPSDGYENEG